MAGQYAPLQQWVSENLTGAVWNQTVAAGEYTFAAYTQDYGEGDASLSANLIATTPAGDPDPPDPAPEPGTWLLAGGVFAGRLAKGTATDQPRRQQPEGCLEQFVLVHGGASHGAPAIITLYSGQSQSQKLSMKEKPRPWRLRRSSASRWSAPTLCQRLKYPSAAPRNTVV